MSLRTKPLFSRTGIEGITGAPIHGLERMTGIFVLKKVFSVLLHIDWTMNNSPSFPLHKHLRPLPSGMFTQVAFWAQRWK